MEREELMGKCLYNGIKLEEIPELTHPFAFMWTTGEDYVLDAVAEKPATYLEDDGQLWISFTYGDRYSNAYLAEDTWNIVTPSEGTATLPASVIVWTNFDLCKEDGTVVLAASEPVPVVEKFPLRQFVEWILPGWGSRPLPMSQKQDVLDNEWPIEWTSTVVANNATKGVSDGYTFVKVSHLTPTADTLSQSTLIVEALSDDAQDVVLSSQGQFGYGEDYLDVGISSAIFFVTFNALVQAAFLLYICVVHIPNESFTETGIYYCLVKEKNAEMVGPSAAPFRFRLSKETEVS